MKIPTDPKDASALRDFFTQQRSQLCSLGQLLGEPWLSHFNGMKALYDDVLTKLGPSDQIPAALDANNQLTALYSMLVSSQSICSMLSTQMDSLKKSTATAQCSAVDAAIAERLTKGELVKQEDVAAAVAAAVKAKTEAGELVPQEMHVQLCSAAKAQGIEAGKAEIAAAEKAAAEQRELVGVRKAALQTASLPLPEGDLEALLTLPEAEFTARQEKAVTRIAGLKAKNAFHSAIAGNVWLDDAGYKTFETLALNVLKQAGHEPLLQDPAKAATAPRSTSFVA